METKINKEIEYASSDKARGMELYKYLNLINE
jgi:hypothetical protein